MRTENRNLLIGTIIGIALGSATAILLAPSPGSETRERLRHATGKTKERARDITARSREYLEMKRKQLQEAVEAGKRAAREKRMELEDQLRTQT